MLWSALQSFRTYLRGLDRYLGPVGRSREQETNCRSLLTRPKPIYRRPSFVADVSASALTREGVIVCGPSLGFFVGIWVGRSR